MAGLSMTMGSMTVQWCPYLYRILRRQVLVEQCQEFGFLLKLPEPNCNHPYSNGQGATKTIHNRQIAELITPNWRRVPGKLNSLLTKCQQIQKQKLLANHWPANENKPKFPLPPLAPKR